MLLPAVTVTTRLRCVFVRVEELRRVDALKLSRTNSHSWSVYVCRTASTLHKLSKRSQSSKMKQPLAPP